MSPNFQDLFRDHKPVIAALHLPPFPGSRHPHARNIQEIEHYAIENAGVFAAGGVDALFLQEQGAPAGPVSDPEVTAYLSVVSRAVRREFPQLPLGIIVNSHGAEVSLAVAKAVGAQFVRFKVYVGAMVKASGIEQGCAYEAVQYRYRIDAEDVAIIADVYDRTGVPLGETTIEEASGWAVRFGCADALVLTGKDFTTSLDMLARVQAKRYGVPLLLGGSATADNVAAALQHADGIIVSSSLMRTSGSAEERDARPWDENAIKRFVEAVKWATHA